MCRKVIFHSRNDLSNPFNQSVFQWNVSSMLMLMYTLNIERRTAGTRSFNVTTAPSASHIFGACSFFSRRGKLSKTKLIRQLIQNNDLLTIDCLAPVTAEACQFFLVGPSIIPQDFKTIGTSRSPQPKLRLCGVALGLKIIAFIDCPVFKGNFGLFRQVNKVVRARANQLGKKITASYVTIVSFLTPLLTFRSGRCRWRVRKSQGPEEAKAKPHLEIFYSLGSFFPQFLAGDSLSWFHGEEKI